MLDLKLFHSKSCIKALKAKQGTVSFQIRAVKVFFAETSIIPLRMKKKPKAMIIIVCEKALRKFSSVNTILKISNIITN